MRTTSVILANTRTLEVCRLDEDAVHYWQALCSQSTWPQVFTFVRQQYPEESEDKLMPATEETQTFFMRLLSEQTKPLLKISTAMAHAFSTKEATPGEVVQVLLEGYQQPQSVRKKFRCLPFAKVDMEASISKAFRSIGISITPTVVPTLVHALKRSDSWSGLELVDNLLFLALGGKTISPEMTVADLTDMQHEVLSTLVKSKNIWGLGNMGFTVGNFFPPQYGLDFSLWDRKDVAQFLLGKQSH